ncbi:unnamed protein product [Mesocestoides corti]|uniref:Uncharacterized protein n=1 Tax=Mesocestoides corti TaxID=53468 RepID=A0A0R3UF09_MESCO|nr:unnamed protein product [Mesocestoides corti]
MAQPKRALMPSGRGECLITLHSHPTPPPLSPPPPIRHDEELKLKLHPASLPVTYSRTGQDMTDKREEVSRSNFTGAIARVLRGQQKKRSLTGAIGQDAVLSARVIIITITIIPIVVVVIIIITGLLSLKKPHRGINCQESINFHAPSPPLRSWWKARRDKEAFCVVCQKRCRRWHVPCSQPNGCASTPPLCNPCHHHRRLPFPPTRFNLSAKWRDVVGDIILSEHHPSVTLPKEVYQSLIIKSSGSATRLIRLLMKSFFTQEELAASSLSGEGIYKQRLQPEITEAIKGMV